MNTPFQPPEDTLTVAHFSTTSVPADLRNDVWREIVNSVFDVSPLSTKSSLTLGGSVTSAALGPLLVGNTTYNSQRFSRHRSSDTDHFLIQRFIRGSQHGDFDGREVRVEAGDICIYDYSQPTSGIALGGETQTIVIPRLLLVERIGQPDMHGLVLRDREPLTRMLTAQIDALFDMLPDLTVADASDVSEMLLSALTVALTQETHQNPHLSAGDHPLQPDVLGFIHEQILDRNFTSDAICQHFGISRTTLYRMFVHEGGISRLLRRKRLDHGLMLLRRERRPQRTVLQIALESGFGNEDQFTRAFKQRFGTTPGEARLTGSGALSSAPAEGCLQARFISRLSRFSSSLNDQ